MSEQVPDMRLACRFLGCGPYGYVCHRCGTGLYDGDYIHDGWLAPLFHLYWRIRTRIVGDGRCHKAAADGGECTLRKGHEGACDDIPF